MALTSTSSSRLAHERWYHWLDSSRCVVRFFPCCCVHANHNFNAFHNEINEPSMSHLSNELHRSTVIISSLPFLAHLSLSVSFVRSVMRSHCDQLTVTRSNGNLVCVESFRLKISWMKTEMQTDAPDWYHGATLSKDTFVPVYGKCPKLQNPKITFNICVA